MWSNRLGAKEQMVMYLISAAYGRIAAKWTESILGAGQAVNLRPPTGTDCERHFELGGRKVIG